MCMEMNYLYHLSKLATELHFWIVKWKKVKHSSEQCNTLVKAGLSSEGVRGVRTNHIHAQGGLLFWWCLFHRTERNGTKRNIALFHGMDKCDNGTINLILERLI